MTSRLLRRERLLVACTVALLAGLSWGYLIRGTTARAMGPMQPPISALILMWWLMMVAMMLPSATPALLLYARVRSTRSDDVDIAQPWVFLAGYLLVWLVFSIAAALLQSWVTEPSMALTDRVANGVVLIAAGIYQLSPLKSACLAECRSPAQFISRHWRPGWKGALRLGMLHGAYCVGCCWLLMALLFVGGVMNLLWVVALAILVAAEKLISGGVWIGRAAGVALLVSGFYELLA